MAHDGVPTTADILPTSLASSPSAAGTSSEHDDRPLRPTGNTSGDSTSSTTLDGQRASQQTEATGITTAARSSASMPANDIADQRKAKPPVAASASIDPYREVFGTPPVGQIGKHKPREIVRIERDYTAGELPQFWSGFPIELEGRVTPTAHLQVMNKLNARLASAYDPYKSIFDNVLAVMTLYISTILTQGHYGREMAQFDKEIEEVNRTVYNPASLNLIDPRSVGYLFLEIEYY
ncbi:uncharacterized protein L969DRAFT_44063 [Mixia osmundae IAM 14324]|uniref:Ras modification protein ERF4 n=1 Tax=Mixia osmundae (strain CBS 9802 / IAM 14324 / JCM 22182 / KY 12970) TaxID=764103 RepID=G7E408_MIXOS|nr:uncharacterized protein L969DRAFT_44063 [Mixia osmundae IAM 14324]KEI42014.1 hypothetical protein L969DRAFT_44063 [Mixia osmundae IAM 14324]GAA97568.1 hypothetical protein E5Q_04246 [Mixia osmundae IAM 14324]